MESPLQQIKLKNPNVSLFVKREDLLHPFVSGNKYRKLKYNLLQAKVENAKTVLTFGGAFSNHIAAVAFAAKKNGLRSIGIIRGEEIRSKIDDNPTLSFAQSCGMELDFVSREEYRRKTDSEFFGKMSQKWGDFYMIPEGGTNELAVKGCEEILNKGDQSFDYVCCAVGTGGTISGLINGAEPHQKVLGFPALKGDFLEEDIRKFAKKENWELVTDYHFGGYGKISVELIDFINRFYQENGILLDPIYTGKMFFGIIDLIEKSHFADQSRILAIHTGGIQGIQGMNKKLATQKLPLINVEL